jgi:hypothetical protein
MSWYVIVVSFVLLLSAPAPDVLFSMIAHSGLCRLTHFEAAMPPRPYRPLLAAVFGVSVPKGSV